MKLKIIDPVKSNSPRFMESGDLWVTSASDCDLNYSRKELPNQSRPLWQSCGTKRCTD